jgi:SAM-dependent methyltransferase
VTRDKILKRWVKQPPVGPNIQYLRDAERLSAWDQLGERNRVLDIASESNVTAGLDADHVTRLDFSPDAIEYAREVLGTDVDRYEVTDPETPDLPFADDDFDGAVSIGPYDWKFLDVRGLTDELHRVVAPEGLLVFSVPTPWSPYATRNWNKYRYFTPREALALVSPDWRLADDDLVFQYPSYSHYAINSLPDRYQEPFVDLAWDLTDRLTARDWWGLASYLVCGVSPLSYSAYLDRALDCLFRPTDENGFWDPREGKIVRALDYGLHGAAVPRADSVPAWSVDDSIQWRYAPFALLGAMRWRTSALGSTDYDGKLKRELNYFAERAANGPTRDRIGSYGIGSLIAAFSLADGAFEGEDPLTDSKHSNCFDVARDLYVYSEERFDFDHAEDCLLAFGWSHLHERERQRARGEAHERAAGSDDGGDGPTEGLRDALDDALWAMNDRLGSDGLFAFENPTTRRHQNQMYALWGLLSNHRCARQAGLSRQRTARARSRDRRADAPGRCLRLGGRPPEPTAPRCGLEAVG